MYSKIQEKQNHFCLNMYTPFKGTCKLKALVTDAITQDFHNWMDKTNVHVTNGNRCSV